MACRLKLERNWALDIFRIQNHRRLAEVVLLTRMPTDSRLCRGAQVPLALELQTENQLQT